MLRLIHLFLIFLFVYIAWLQLNDPDPLFWASLYLLTSLAPLTHLINQSFRGRHYLLGLASGYCLAGIAMVFSGATNYLPHMGQESLLEDMSADKPYIEEMRELLGTLIALATVAVYSWLAYGKQPSDTKIK